MAAALSEGDTPAQHAADTVVAGAGLVDEAMARLLAEEGPAAVRALAALGAPFDRPADGGFAQSLEAAHSRPRIARVKGDQAGQAIMEAVTVAVLAARHIEVRTGHRLRGLLQDERGRVRGVLAETHGQMVEITARAVILATGGIGGLYAVTTTPAELKGEGLALAALAGAEIADPEFVQFHPTAIDIGRDPAPLATEALRGEGAVLVNGDGQRFMARYHPDAELAPRDVVARAIHAERAAGRGAFLDARKGRGRTLPRGVPGGVRRLHGRRRRPARPADPGGAGLPLPHGRDRDRRARPHVAGRALPPPANAPRRGSMAPTAWRRTRCWRLPCSARAPAAPRPGRPIRGPPRWSASPLPISPPKALADLRQAMSRDAGVVRTAAGLTRLLGELDALEAADGRAAPLVAARLVAACALARTESRGGHYRADGVPAQAPRRTFIRWADLPAASSLRYAAE